MSLWNLIRDFFVENIFGGTASSGTNYYFKVNAYNTTGQLQVFEDLSGNVHLSLGDWLSDTFTIITLILLVIFLYIFVKWIFKLFSGLLR